MIILLEIIFKLLKQLSASSLYLFEWDSVCIFEILESLTFNFKKDSEIKFCTSEHWALYKRIVCYLCGQTDICFVPNRLEMDSTEETAWQLLQRPKCFPRQEGQLLLHPPDRWGSVWPRHGSLQKADSLGLPRELSKSWRVGEWGFLVIL